MKADAQTEAAMMAASKAGRTQASLDEHAGMRVRQTKPLNIGAPLELVRQAFVTPQDCFFVRNHGAVPHLHARSFRLSVSGHVQHPLELSLDDLRTRFPASTVMATLQCAGHRRDELAVVASIPGEILWGATWTSAALLDEQQPWIWCFWEATISLEPGARQLVVRASDTAGDTQPEDVRQVWNWKGYLNNAWHRVNVIVR